MELLLNTQEERCRMEVYNEYLRKIPQLLTQLEAVEKMYEKAVLEEKMLKDKDPQDQSVILPHKTEYLRLRIAFLYVLQFHTCREIPYQYHRILRQTRLAAMLF